MNLACHHPGSKLVLLWVTYSVLWSLSPATNALKCKSCSTSKKDPGPCLPNAPEHDVECDPSAKVCLFQEGGLVSKGCDTVATGPKCQNGSHICLCNKDMCNAGDDIKSCCSNESASLFRNGAGPRAFCEGGLSIGMVTLVSVGVMMMTLRQV